MNNSVHITRRQFVKTAAAAVGFPYAVSSAALGKFGAVCASDKITLGLIGTGGMGAAWWGHLPALLEMPDVKVLAVCDVDKNLRDKAKLSVDKRYANNDCACCNDYRRIIERNDIDAVVITSPDHWHAKMTVDAARAGKDIYCEKPLTRTFAEGLAVRDAIKKYGVVFQHGTQQRSDARMVFGCELVLNGRIGRLKNVKMGIPPGERTVPQKTENIPEGFDYDMWLGPAPYKPYCRKRVEGGITHSWYFLSDYSIGHLSGWGIHHIDSAQQGCGTDYTGPVEIEGKAEFPEDGLYDNAVTWDIRYTFENGITWECTDTGKNRMGIIFEGTDGWVYVWRGIVDAGPKSLLKQIIGPDEIRLYKSADHRRNFVDCIKTRRITAAPVEIAHRSNTICVLGDIAARLGRKLKWDPKNECFIRDEQANRMLERPYRAPWQL